MRAGLLKTVQFKDDLSNRFQQNVKAALETLSSDDDILRLPATFLVATAPIPPGKSVVVYQGKSGATLTLSLASAQGPSVAAVVMFANESTGAVTLQASGSDKVNGATTLSVASGALVTLVADGVTSWLALVPSTAPYDVIANAPFTSVSSVSASWTAGKYRRLELHLRVTSAAAGNATATLTGLGGTYTSWNVYNFGATASPSPWSSNAYASSWAFQNGGYLGQTDGDFQIATGGLRTFQARTLDASNGYVLLSQGSNSDTTSQVSGMTVTLPGAASGRFELLGFT